MFDLVTETIIDEFSKTKAVGNNTIQFAMKRLIIFNFLG